MKRIFLFTALLSVVSFVNSQTYIIENRNLIKIIKTQGLSKEGKFNIVLIKDTIGVGDFDSIPIPSEYLKTAVQEGYVEYIDTIAREPEGFPLGKIFFKEIVKRTQVITRDGDSDDFEVDKLFTVIKKDWNNGSVLLVCCLLILIPVTFIWRFFKK